MLTSRLKEARLRAGLSQERLGTLAGLDEMSASSRMNQYERGKHTPGFFLIERLAQALNMPTPWFYTRDDDMADLLLAYNTLPADQKEKALAYVRELAAHADGHAVKADGHGIKPDGRDGKADGHAIKSDGHDGKADGHGPVADGHGAIAGHGSKPDGAAAATYTRPLPGQSPNTTPVPLPSSDGRSRK